jgi:hypothetical protein
MKFHKVMAWVGALTLLAAAWFSYRWAGVALVVTGGVMWILLHFTRTLQVLKRATHRPKGHVASAVMLNAKLQAGATLLHVIAMTKSLGESLGGLPSSKEAQPEVFRWTDTSASHVTCTFQDGKLTTWVLWRPEQVDEANEAAPVPTAS